MSRILIAATLLILSSCATQKRCSNKFPPAESSRIDSVYIYRDVVRWKDTIIYKELPPVVIERYASIKDTLKLTGSYSEALSWVSGGDILGVLNEGKNPVKIEYKIKEVEVEKEVFKTEYKEAIHEVRFVPKLVKILAHIGAASILSLFIYVLIRFYRP